MNEEKTILPNATDPLDDDPMMRSFIEMSLVLARELGKRLDQEEAAASANAEQMAVIAEPAPVEAAYPPEITELLAIVERVQRENAMLRAERDHEELVALKEIAADTNCNLETGRLWCEKGIVDAIQLGKRWYVYPSSFKAAHALLLQNKNTRLA
jgi:hypothetical protein